MKFTDFRTCCILNGDSPEAVDSFVEWVRKHMHIWKAFERIAYQDMRKGHRGDPMWTMGELRRRHKVSVVNAVSPGLCRMFNFKHKKRFFQISKMRSFSAEFKEAA